MDMIAAELPMMRRYAGYLCRFDNEAFDMADDVAAVAIERALVNRHRFKPDFPLTVQLRGLVKYAFLSRRSKGDDAKKAKEEFDEEYEVAQQALTEDPTDRVFLSQMIERINGLQRDLRNPMLLFVYGFSFEEIAVTLGASADDVADLIYQARKAIGVVDQGALSGLLRTGDLKRQFAA